MSEHIKPEQSMAFMALASDDAERQQAEAHAVSCDVCRQALDEAQLMLGWIDAHAPLPVANPALKARVRRAVLSSQALSSQPPSQAVLNLPSALPKWLLATGMMLSLWLAWLDGEPGALAPSLGIKCMLFENMIAVAPFTVAAYLGMRGRIAFKPLNLATVSMAGALVGQVLLHVRCESHATAHLFAFHVLGVALAAAVGYAATTRLVRIRNR